jgi:hypothetical protein
MLKWNVLDPIEKVYAASTVNAGLFYNARFYALSLRGFVWTFGDFGDGGHIIPISSVDTLGLVSGLKEHFVTKIATGDAFDMFLTNEGKVFFR